MDLLFWLLVILSIVKYSFLYNRTNKYCLPIITSLFSRAGETLKADYYGYINSDILIEPSIFSVLDYCKDQVDKGALSEQVGMVTRCNQ